MPVLTGYDGSPHRLVHNLCVSLWKVWTAGRAPV